jgi:hypothetical protein
MDSEEQIFWTFFITTMCGFILALGRMMYKSKCKEIEICCIKIVRDVETEGEVDQAQISHPPPNRDEFQVEGQLQNV